MVPSVTGSCLDRGNKRKAAMNEINPPSELTDSSASKLEDVPEEQLPSAPFPDEQPAEHVALLPEKPSTFRYLVFGADGLRAGWALLLFIAILFGTGYAIRLTTKAIRNHHSSATASKAAQASGGSGKTAAASEPMSPRAALIGEGSAFLMVMFATLIMSRIERRPFGAYGLGGTNRLPQLLAGLFWGVTCLSILVGLLRWSGFLQFDA